jgi:carboxypeptidase C (cathepsin A)
MRVFASWIAVSVAMMLWPAAVVAEPQTVTTQGVVTVGGQLIRYTADAGALVLRDGRNRPTAEMFYVAYFKDAAKASGRPIAFLYNGGPGSSSSLLLMGAFGPVLVMNGSDGAAAPYRLGNNESSLIDASDLVFVDAVGTGFSRILGGDEGGAGTPKMFYGVDPDATSFAQFIERFLSKYGRWNSPKFLIGQSYGATRSAVLAYVLEEDAMIPLNGLVLMGASLNFDASSGQPSLNPGINLPYALSLPTYAAAAWYHGLAPRAPQDLRAWLDEAQTWAMGPYLAALDQGAALPAAARARIAATMSRYTGLPESYILSANLRVARPQFEHELLLAKGEVTSSLDARFAGRMIDPLSENAEYDSELGYLTWAYTAAVNDYLRGTLHFGRGRRYTFYAPDINSQWDLLHSPPGADGPAYTATNVMGDLAFEMTVNPRMKVMVNAGYFDLDTPYYAAVYQFAQLPMARGLQSNIEFHFYRTGHMIYMTPGALPQLHDNISRFIRAAARAGIGRIRQTSRSRYARTTPMRAASKMRDTPVNLVAPAAVHPKGRRGRSSPPERADESAPSIPRCPQECSPEVDRDIRRP